MSYQKIFQKLSASTDEDILLHFPRRYDDLTLTDIRGGLADGQKTVMLGSPQHLISLNNGAVIRFGVACAEDGEPVPCIVFGQPFYQRVLRSSGKYYFFGIYKARQKAIVISLAVSSDSPLVKNRFKPYYVLPREISQSSFYGLILNILSDRTDYINETLPRQYRLKYRLEDRLSAFKDVHIPVSRETIERGLRVFKYEEALAYCLASAYRKKADSGIKKKEMLPISRPKINSFVASLPYALTSGQLEAVRQIISDMDRPRIMVRLLQGDVGTGKTIVAFIAAYANYLRKGQTALMAPTLTLAEQHYRRALKIFAPFGLKVALLSNALKSKEAKEVLSGLKNGSTDFVIGTQSLFSDNVVYNNLSLAIADEQHKFGVAQRARLINKGQGVDSLMMSATPIPRTLSMIVNSDLDVSFLDEFPAERRKVITKVISSADPLIDKAIRKALSVKKQVFIVAPKIEKSAVSDRLSSKAVYEDAVKKYGAENVALLTGRVNKEHQKAVYDDFVSGRRLILVSTSLIEVGVDVKNAVLMIVYEANYFGLASLHQLRGRIGRIGQGAMALLVYDGDDPEALDKLMFLAAHDDGQRIAEYDLQHRGAGDLGGERQAGESSLQVANFVTDYRIFDCARKDADEILSSPDSPENKAYLAYVLQRECH